MSKVGKVHPVSILLGSALKVKVSVVNENTSLLNILLVVGILLGGGFSTDLLVLGLGQAGGDVGAIIEGSCLEVLLSACTVVVGIRDGSPKVHVGNGLEESIQLGGGGSLGGGGEGRGGGHGGSDDECGSLHFGW